MICRIADCERAGGVSRERPSSTSGAPHGFASRPPDQASARVQRAKRGVRARPGGPRSGADAGRARAGAAVGHPSRSRLESGEPKGAGYPRAFACSACLSCSRVLVPWSLPRRSEEAEGSLAGVAGQLDVGAAGGAAGAGEGADGAGAFPVGDARRTVGDELLVGEEGDDLEGEAGLRDAEDPAGRVDALRARARPAGRDLDGEVGGGEGRGAAVAIDEGAGGVEGARAVGDRAGGRASGRGRPRAGRKTSPSPSSPSRWRPSPTRGPSTRCR